MLGVTVYLSLLYVMGVIVACVAVTFAHHLFNSFSLEVDFLVL